MHRKRRETLLKIAVGAVVGLFLLDRIVISWAVDHWKEQSKRIAELRERVQRGRLLVERSKALRARWSEMQRSDLHDNGSAAENDVYKAVEKWARASRIGFTNLTPQWRPHDDGYDTLEIRGAATGDQASIARLLYELEADPLPARVSEMDLSARDAQGKQLNLSLRFSFVRLTDAKKNAR
jgi:hypothetical protein